MSEKTTAPAKRKSGIYRLGVIVLVALAALTLGEYFVAITFNSMVVLFLFAILKGALVLYYFMHIATLWSEEGGH